MIEGDLENCVDHTACVILLPVLGSD
jgi:hypothetical protein